jgi:LacI family transcriptional regulator
LDVNSIDVDNIHAGWQATLHLLRFGRKRVATITGSQDQIVGFDRYQGYLRALQDYNLTLNPDLVAEGDFTEEGGYAAMLRLVPQEPDAVFAASDMMAYGAMRALREANLRIPEDVAVFGFDDNPASATMEPPLTTIRQSARSMGAMAVETLIDIIDHPGSEPRHIIVATELVIRSSCGTLKSISEGGDVRKNPVNLSIPTLNQPHQ